MSSIRSISDAGAYTVVGGGIMDREQKDGSGLSIVLLNRGAKPFRTELFSELCKLGVREVISIESGPCPYDVDVLAKRYERLRFMIFARDSSIGARIDAAFRESMSDYVFVLQGDMKITASAISSRVFSKISDRGRLCTVPVFRDDDDELLPSAMAPVLSKDGRFDVHPMRPEGAEAPTVMPWDYAGIYNKERHFAIGGFDSAIPEPWWQKLEYGMRAWLWGEEIRTHSALKMGYMEEIPPEDTSVGSGYRRFFLKTLAVKRRGDSTRLPLSRWWLYLRTSGENSRAAKDSWKDVRHWVRSNRYRFTLDAAGLIELWDWRE
jgi:hypothetical protein